MSYYEKIKSQLAAAGVRVYLPGMYKGECREPYVVVQDSGTYSTAETRRSGYSLIAVWCFVPLNQYSLLSSLVTTVKKALYPFHGTLLAPTGNEGTHSINNTYKSHTTYVEYQVLRKLF